MRLCRSKSTACCYANLWSFVSWESDQFRKQSWGNSLRILRNCLIFTLELQDNEGYLIASVGKCNHLHQVPTATSLLTRMTYLVHQGLWEMDLLSKYRAILTQCSLSLMQYSTWTFVHCTYNCMYICSCLLYGGTYFWYSTTMTRTIIYT